MKPVFQQIVDKDRGDCVAACLASLFEIGIGDVPSFCAEAVDAGGPYPGSDSWTHILRWCDSKGFSFAQFSYKVIHHWNALQGQYVLASMPSQRFPGSTHMVVAQWQDDPRYEGALRLVIVHDPNSGNDAYSDEVKPIMVTFLIPKSPRLP